MDGLLLLTENGDLAGAGEPVILQDNLCAEVIAGVDPALTGSTLLISCRFLHECPGTGRMKSR